MSVTPRGRRVHPERRPGFPVSIGEAGLAQKLTLLRSVHDLSDLSSPLREQKLQVDTLTALCTDSILVQP
ncbi:hypothetical protein [Citrobacter koseri]|uniref:hypothetical protein n=1 Tax=Citrobacter koseri TaxID=545 RepID=UPI000E0EE8E6|nr:hypothetical protein [Citrobacter koseri]